MTRFTTTCLAIAVAALPVSAAAQVEKAPPAQADHPTRPTARVDSFAKHAPPSQAEVEALQRGLTDSAQHGEAAAPPKDFIMPHIVDSRHLELPWPAPPFYKTVNLPQWKPLHIGNFELDLSPTKHVVFALFAATLCALLLIMAARSHARQTAANGHPRGFAAAVEGLVLWLRNEIILPNVGHHGEKFVPFVLALFFFILIANLIGLLPWSATVTSNISVTATLAILSFLVIEISGMRALGRGYIKTIVYFPPSDMPILMKPVMVLVMTPVEILGKFTKPFALALRLFANMTGGHIVVLALISLIFAFPKYGIFFLPAGLTVAIMALELFVACLQAFVFALLTAVFIGQVRESHH